MRGRLGYPSDTSPLNNRSFAFNSTGRREVLCDDCQVKPKLISYMLMKSLTFFSLGAAHASQVYTKTVNSGLFTALLALYTTTRRP